MSPTTSSVADKLVSRRASTRPFQHFTVPEPDEPPAGFVAHSKPVPLGGGTPNHRYFPVKRISVEVEDYPFHDTLFAGQPTGDASISIERESLKGLIGLNEGLQYGSILGLAPFLKFLRQLVERVHPPKYDNWGIIPTNGSGDALQRAADVVLDRGDTVLLEEFSFTPFVNSVNDVGAIAVPVRLTLDGKNPGLDLEYLENLLDNWESIHPGLKRPKAFYTIPSGQNPTVITQTVETRTRVYGLASKHNFVIIEDDPYGYLTLGAAQKPDVDGLHTLDLLVDDYLENLLVPSYLTLDTEGRVLRLETFSKVFLPGLRLGFIVGHQKFIDALKIYALVVTRAPSGPSQLIFHNMVQQHLGGVDGYLRWILKVRLAYIHRRNVLVGALTDLEAFRKGYLKILGSDAGMFASVLVNFPEGTDTVAKLKLLNYKFLQHGVTVILGFKLAVDRDFSKDNCNFLRISFAPAHDDRELVEGGQRLAAAVEEFFDKGLEF